MLLDEAGNLNGTTMAGGSGDEGTVFQLSPSGSGWTLNTLHSFAAFNDGFAPYGGLIADNAGNFYGATANGTPDGNAVIFELSPSGGGWTYSILYTFQQSYGAGPAATLAMDSVGNLYGTTRGYRYDGSDPHGSVFRLSPSNGGWTYTDLHDFNGSDGDSPYSSVLIDAAGNLYGTTLYGGSSAVCSGGCGVVWKFAP